MHRKIVAFLVSLTLFVIPSCNGQALGKGPVSPGVPKAAKTQVSSPVSSVPLTLLTPEVKPSKPAIVGPTASIPTSTPAASESFPSLQKGRILFYRSIPGGGRSLYMIDNTGIHMLTDGTFSVHVALLSPDGQKLALVSDRDGPDNIYLLNVDGGALRKLTNFPAGASWPAWSPDGKKIAFTGRAGIRQEHVDQFDIFLVDVSTGGLTNLTNTDCCDEVGPTWSPDGQKIAFAGGWGVSVINVDGTGRSDLLPSTMAEMHFSLPTWSPDGRWIVGAYNADPYYRDIWKIYLLTPDGTTFRLTNFDLEGYPEWSPDGKKMVSKSVVGFLYVLDLTSMKVTKLVEGECPTWSPDSQGIAFELDGFLYLLDLSSGSTNKLTWGECPKWYP